MEYMTPNFTKDMVKTHKILIPNMAVTQFRLLQAALECEGYNVEVLGNCGSEVAQLGLKYVHNDTCYPALLVIGQFIDALNSGKYDLDHTALLITQTGGGCRASNYIKLLRKALVKAGYGNIPVASLNFSGLEKGSGLPLTLPLIRKVIACIYYGDLLVALRSQTKPYENKPGSADALTEKWIATIQSWMHKSINYNVHDMKRQFAESQGWRCGRNLRQVFAPGQQRSGKIPGKPGLRSKPARPDGLCGILCCQHDAGRGAVRRQQGQGNGDG